MKFSEIYESAEPGETFQRPGLDRDEPAMFNAAGKLIYANSRLSVKLSLEDYRADDWEWVKRHPRCEKCGQRLPEGWTASKQGMSLMEIAEQWKEGDQFTNPYLGGYTIKRWSGHIYMRSDLLRTDWYFTTRCQSCGQRIGDTNVQR